MAALCIEQSEIIKVNQTYHEKLGGNIFKDSSIPNFNLFQLIVKPTVI